MADIDAIFNDDDFFTEIDKPESKQTEKPKWTPFADGEYCGHISNVVAREVNTHKGKHKAMVFNFKLTVDEANAGRTYQYEWGNKTFTANGSEYIGKKINACGVFRYLVPKEGDDFTAHPEGNRSYGYFCQAIGIELPTIEKEINGETVKVKSLPTIKPEDIEGVPVIGVVGKGKPYTNSSGKQTTPSEVKFVKAWKDGVKKETVSDEDIPF